MLGGLGSGVTEGNVMQYLGVIESRTNEILQLYMNLRDGGGTGGGQKGTEEDQDLESVDRAGGLLALPAVTGPVRSAETDPSQQVSINPPSAVEDDEDEEGRPLTREELQLRTSRAIRQRAADDTETKK